MAKDDDVKGILKASWHRNGISGMGFYAIIFYLENGEKMFAALFDEPGYCAVVSIPELAKENIEFAHGNSWRGDVYASQLRPLLEKYLENTGTNRIGPFGMPDKKQ